MTPDQIRDDDVLRSLRDYYASNAASAMALVCDEPTAAALTELLDARAEIERLRADIEFLTMQNEACHEPASRYELLIDMLNGIATTHGDCPVYAEIERLRKVADRWEPRYADGETIDNHEDVVVFTVVNGKVYEDRGALEWHYWSGWGVSWGGPHYDSVCLDKCYSTREAAERAGARENLTKLSEELDLP